MYLLIARNIRELGAPTHSDTRLGEGMHVKLKQLYRATNHRDEEKQIVGALVCRETMDTVMHSIERADPHAADDDELVYPASLPSPPVLFSPLPNSTYLTVAAFLPLRPDVYPSPYHFEVGLRIFAFDWLENDGSTHQQPSLNMSSYPIVTDLPLCLFQRVDITYHSPIDLSYQHCILRCLPSEGRFDGVLVHRNDEIFPATLLGLFRYNFKQQDHDIAFVRPFPYLPKRDPFGNIQLSHVPPNQAIFVGLSDIDRPALLQRIEVAIEVEVKVNGKGKGKAKAKTQKTLEVKEECNIANEVDELRREAQDKDATISRLEAETAQLKRKAASSRGGKKGKNGGKGRSGEELGNDVALSSAQVQAEKDEGSAAKTAAARFVYDVDLFATSHDPAFDAVLPPSFLKDEKLETSEYADNPKNEWETEQDYLNEWMPEGLQGKAKKEKEKELKAEYEEQKAVRERFLLMHGKIRKPYAERLLLGSFQAKLSDQMNVTRNTANSRIRNIMPKLFPGQDLSDAEVRRKLVEMDAFTFENNIFPLVASDRGNALFKGVVTGAIQGLQYGPEAVGGTPPYGSGKKTHGELIGVKEITPTFVAGVVTMLRNSLDNLDDPAPNQPNTGRKYRAKGKSNIPEFSATRYGNNYSVHEKDYVDLAKRKVGKAVWARLTKDIITVARSVKEDYEDENQTSISTALAEMGELEGSDEEEPLGGRGQKKGEKSDGEEDEGSYPEGDDDDEDKEDDDEEEDDEDSEDSEDEGRKKKKRKTDDPKGKKGKEKEKEKNKKKKAAAKKK
ncbi:hypothetical protein JCM11641_005438 [Rhodosporidiobolus odoratus]